MSDFKTGGVPAPDYDKDDVTIFNDITEFTNDVYVYGKLYAEFGGDVQTFSTAGVERLRISPGGTVRIGSDTHDSRDIDASHTKLTIKQTAYSREDGIYIERNGERKGYYIHINPGAGAGDALTFARNNDGTKSDVLSLDRDGLVRGTLHTLIGEHSSATSVGELFSFGNGAVDNQGPAMPFAGKVIVVTISKSGGSNSGIFQPSKNGVTQGGASDQITTTTGSGSVTKNNADYTSLMDFNAGDRINYVTVDATDTSTCLTMLVRFNPI